MVSDEFNNRIPEIGLAILPGYALAFSVSKPTKIAGDIPTVFKNLAKVAKVISNPEQCAHIAPQFFPSLKRSTSHMVMWQQDLGLEVDPNIYCRDVATTPQVP